jgi:glycine cleavage system aminomethyltransferase T
VRLDAPGEFLGKDRLREFAAAPPNRFVTLTYESETLPEYGAEVTQDGEEVGVLTSPTDSPRFGKIGIAIIRTERSTLGNTVQVAVGDGTVDATVDVLPIYDTNKDRPRS